MKILREKTQNLEILKVLRQINNPHLSFFQKSSEATIDGEAPVIQLDYYVRYGDLGIEENYLTILTTSMVFGSHDGMEGHSLSRKARQLVQEGVDFIKQQLREGPTAGEHCFSNHQTYLDFDPIELQIRWLEYQMRSECEAKCRRASRYLERRYELRFNHLEELLELQWNLKEQGHDLMLFRDLFIPYAEVVDAMGDSRCLLQLQDFIMGLPRSLCGFHPKERSRCLDLMYLAIAYLEDCFSTNPGEITLGNLNTLSQILTKDHHLDMMHYDELAGPIYLEKGCASCIENLELVLAKRTALGSMGE